MCVVVSCSDCVSLCVSVTPVLGNMVGLKPSDVPPPLGVKMASAGAAACVADLFTFPLDTAKVRLQVSAQWKKKIIHYLKHSWHLHFLKWSFLSTSLFESSSKNLIKISRKIAFNKKYQLTNEKVS